MKRRSQNWLAALGAAYPSAFSAYWRALPISRMKSLLAATFFTGAVAGFAADLLQIDTHPLGAGFYWPVSLGLVASGSLLTRIKSLRLVLPTILLMFVILWIGARAVKDSAHIEISAIAQRRVMSDAIGVLVCGALGYRLLLSFVSFEGLANVRMQTELALAHGIQSTLVPTLSIERHGLEIYGKSMPSAEMGGDLLDVIETDGSLIAYAADVSGHGLPAGQLMGMLKASLRAASQSHAEPTSLLEVADRVLPALKDPSMYATIAMVRFDGSEQAEYALAGHVPILHYRPRSREANRLSMEAFPLGLIPGTRYESGWVDCSSGDIFVILTDGISEVLNAEEQEFGLSSVEDLLLEHAGEPLPTIWQAIVGRANRHGRQADDQSVMLVRVQ
jgi:serine phosphatase RsbU (regulator of sigma subunit)